MNVELITPSITTCSLRLYDAKIPAKKIRITDWHIHTEIEMVLILTGTKTFYIEDEIIWLNAGDIIFVNSNIPHKTETPVGSSCVLLQFNTSSKYSDNSDYLWLENIGSITNFTHTVLKKDSDINSGLTNCIQKIRYEFSEKKKSYDYFIKSYIYEVTAILYRNEILVDYNEWLQRVRPLTEVLKYINEHYNEHISLSKISGILNFHSSYFCKFFKNIIGFSFIEYLNLVRLNKAKELMKSTSKSITEISFEVGFSSVSYFIKTFRKYNYCSPNKYRSFL